MGRHSHSRRTASETTMTSLSLKVSLLVIFMLLNPLFTFCAPQIITQSHEGGDQYVRYHVNKPLISYQSNMEETGQRGPRILFDGDIYYSDAKP